MQDDADGNFDLIVVGGGINGTGIARDAAGRGLRVLLCEKDDLAAHTSSASTKLIHGGLRYLEQYEFRLVRKALKEREILLRAAPHIIRPMRFIMPHVRGLRPRPVLRLGLMLYDSLGGRISLPRSQAIDLRNHPAGRLLRDDLHHGYAYSDCWVEDARLVVLNALDAAEYGARVLTRTACVGAERTEGHWRVTLKDTDSGTEREVTGRALVNAAGPWVTQPIKGHVPATGGRGIRLVKGSHLVVPRLTGHQEAYILQNPDRRVVFVIPFEQRYTLIGTTEEPFTGDPARARISEAETAYLCDTVNRFFRQQITPQQVAWSYSGVRPLFDDAADNTSTVTRDYVLDLDGSRGTAPLLTVYGGKITTYRRLAEDVMTLLSRPLGLRAPPWTGQAHLPGGDIPGGVMETWLTTLGKDYPWLPESLRDRYAHTYGTRIHRLLAGAGSLEDMGDWLGDDIYERELAYLAAMEWARSAEDMLWRRTRRGLHVSGTTRAAVADWFRRHARDAIVSPRRWQSELPTDTGTVNGTA